MRPLRFFAPALAASLFFASPSPAFAQDDFQKKEAHERFKEGVVLMNEGKHEQARVKFVQAYAANKVPNVTFNLARAEHLTNHALEAARHYREYLRTADPKKLSAKDRADIDGWLRDLGKTLAQLEIAAPAGAHLTVDGDRVGDAPLAEPQDVLRGKHTVVAEVKGKRLTTEADATGGGLVKVVLAEEAPPAAITSGNPASPPPPPNDHVTPPPKETRETWGTGQYLGVGLVGAGAIAVGVGVVFAIGKGNSADRVAALEPQTSGCSANPALKQCQELQDRKDEESQRGALSTGFFIGGAVAIVAGVVTYFVWPKATVTTSGMTLAPTIGARSGGFELRF